MKDLLLIDMHKVFASDNKTLVPLTFPVRHGTAFACAKPAPRHLFHVKQPETGYNLRFR